MLLQGVSLPYQNMQCGLPGCLPQLSLSLRSFYLLGLGVLIADCWVNMAGFQSAETASPPVGFCHCSVVSENWGSLPHPHSLVNRVQQGMDDLCSTIGNSVSQVGTGHSSVPSSPQHCQDLQACDSIWKVVMQDLRKSILLVWDTPKPQSFSEVEYRSFWATQGLGYAVCKRNWLLVIQSLPHWLRYRFLCHPTKCLL